VRACLSCLLLFLLGAPSLIGASTIAFQFRDGMIWVDVAVSGSDEHLAFLLDSGAGTTVIDLAAARRLGLKLGRSQSVQGVGGRTVAYATSGFDASAAGVPISSSPLALDLSGPSAGCGRRIDGLIGADFFRTRAIQINYAARSIRLLDRAATNALQGEILPLALRSDALCARISINGNKPEWLRLDTGCNTALEWVIGKRGTNALPQTTIGLHAGSVRETLTNVTAGTRQITGVKTGIHSRPMFAGESGLIGNGLLSRFTVAIDVRGRRCILSER